MENAKITRLQKDIKQHMKTLEDLEEKHKISLDYTIRLKEFKHKIDFLIHEIDTLLRQRRLFEKTHEKYKEVTDQILERSHEIDKTKEQISEAGRLHHFTRVIEATKNVIKQKKNRLKEETMKMENKKKPKVIYNQEEMKMTTNIQVVMKIAEKQYKECIKKIKSGRYGINSIQFVLLYEIAKKLKIGKNGED